VGRARSPYSKKPNNPPGEPAGFADARRVCSEKPNDPPGKPAGFAIQGRTPVLIQPYQSNELTFAWCYRV
jgi:hypothetical protein